MVLFYFMVVLYGCSFFLCRYLKFYFLSLFFYLLFYFNKNVKRLEFFYFLFLLVVVVVLFYFFIDVEYFKWEFFGYGVIFEDIGIYIF